MGNQKDMCVAVTSKISTGTSSDSDPYTARKSLVDLDVAEVTTWLQSIRLDKAFGNEFVDQLIDGECLTAAVAGDLERSGEWALRHVRTLAHVHARMYTDFPKARGMHWKKFWY